MEEKIIKKVKQAVPTDIPPKKNLSKYFWPILLVLLILLLLIGSFSFFIFADSKVKSNLAETVKNDVIPTPTPFLFQEMTIPALRSRTYSSQLGPRDLVSTNSNYASYLTSYTSDGYKINAQLTIPTGREPEGGWPAIVFIHGYIPPASYQTLGNYASYVDYLASSGFVILKIDLRGHGSSEGEAGGGYFGSDYVVDTLNARAALASSGLVNPRKIGLWGHSMAGNIVMRSLAANPDIPAVVIWAGAVYTYQDQQDYGINDNSYQAPSEDSPNRRKRNELIKMYGQFSPSSEFWKQVAPTNYLDGIKGAVQINHAVDDSVVSINYSRNLNRILDKTNIVHELEEYPTGGHNFTGTTFNSAMQNTIEFFKKHL